MKALLKLVFSGNIVSSVQFVANNFASWVNADKNELLLYQDEKENPIAEFQNRCVTRRIALPAS